MREEQLPPQEEVRGDIPSGAHSQDNNAVSDTGGEATEKVICSCAICLQSCRAMDQRTGMLDCSHFFHDACIVEWSMTESKCPICKAPFSVIHVGGRSILVAEVEQMPSPEDDDVDPEQCSRCSVTSTYHKLVLCSGCGYVMHNFCCEWYCEACYGWQNAAGLRT